MAWALRSWFTVIAFCATAAIAGRTCPKPYTVLPLSWNIIDNSVIGNGTDFVVPGTMVQFTCRLGEDDASSARSYELVGVEKITCLRTGSWSDPVPACKLHHQLLSTTPEDARSDNLPKDAMTIIVIVGAVVTFLVFATFVFVVVARRWYPSDCNRRRRLLQTTAVASEDPSPSDYLDSDRDLLVTAAAAAHLRCAPFAVAPPPSYEESMAAAVDGQRSHMYTSYTDDDCSSDLRFMNAFRSYRPLVGTGGGSMEPALVSTRSSLTDAGLDTRSLGAQSALASGAVCANRCHRYRPAGRTAGAAAGTCGNDTVSEILPCDATSASDASTFVTLSTYDGTNSSRASGLVCSLASAGAAADAQSDCPSAAAAAADKCS